MTVKSSATVNCTVDKFHEFVNANSDAVYEAIHDKDSMNITCKRQHTFDDDHCIVYSAYKAPIPFIVWPRDFCYMKTRELMPKYRTSDNKEHYLSVDVCYSIDEDHPYYVPHQRGRVRAEIIVAGLLFDKIDETHSRAYYICSVDAKGWIPTYLANIAATEQGYNIRWVKDLAFDVHTE